MLVRMSICSDAQHVGTAVLPIHDRLHHDADAAALGTGATLRRGSDQLRHRSTSTPLISSQMVRGSSPSKAVTTTKAGGHLLCGPGNRNTAALLAR